MYLFFDIETTGLSKSSDILEFAAIECDDNFCIRRVINNYYLYDGEVPPGASKINGLTREKLEFLADSDFISDAENIYELLSRPDITVVGHNILAYDLPVVYNNLHRAGLELSVPSNRCIDTLPMARKRYEGKHDLQTTLAAVLKDGNLSLTQIKQLFSNSKLISPQIKDKKMTFHSGLFDAFVSYVIYTSWNL